MKRLDGLFIGVVFAHLVTVLVHTVAHLQLQIVPGPADLAFIAVVIMVAPVAALPILRLHRLTASGLLAVSMAASFAYGFQGHFLSGGPDHVTITADPWTLLFVATGVVLGVVELLGVVVAAFVFRGSFKIPSERVGPPGRSGPGSP